MSEAAAAAAAEVAGGGDSGGEQSEGLTQVAGLLAGMRPAGGAEQGEGAEDGGETETPPAEAKHRIKVAGEEREVSTDELVRLAQKNASADRYLEQAKAEAKAIEAERMRIEKAAKDPLVAAYLKGGTDGLLDAVADLLEYEQMPPEERTKRDQQKELERKAKRADELEAKERTEREQQMTQQYVARIEGEVTAIIGAAGLPETPHTIRRAAGLLEAAMMAGDKSVTRDKLASALKGEMSGDLSGYLAKLEPEQLAEMLGEEGVKRWRSWDSGRVKPASPIQRAAPPAGRPRAAPKAEKAVRTSEFFKKLRGD